MTKPKLTYFDAPISRGEECRLALHVAGIDFEDVRIKPADWPMLKPKTPFGSMPLFELPGRPVLAQSNAILVYLGRTHGLHPKDDFEAARHEGVMAHVEDLRHAISPTLRMEEAEKKRVRENLVATTIPAWGASTEKAITSDGPFFGGASLNVVDLKLYVAVKWLASGNVDHIPASIFAAYPKLVRIHDAVRDHAGVKSWYARS